MKQIISIKPEVLNSHMEKAYSKEHHDVGKVIGYLEILAVSPCIINGKTLGTSKKAYAKAKCLLCGNIISTRLDNLKCGFKVSCGCTTLKQGIGADPSTFWAYRKIQRWCGETNIDMKDGSVDHKMWKHYGGTGARLCKEWLTDFRKFLIDMGERPDKRHWIFRRDFSKSFCKDNCYWAIPSPSIGYPDFAKLQEEEERLQEEEKLRTSPTLYDTHNPPTIKNEEVVVVPKEKRKLPRVEHKKDKVTKPKTTKKPGKKPGRKRNLNAKILDWDGNDITDGMNKPKVSKKPVLEIEVEHREVPLISVFVYGSLKKGFWNHHFIGNTEHAFVGKASINNYKLYHLVGGGFPAIVSSQDKEAVVWGEVYMITKQTLGFLDLLENVKGGLYTPTDVTVKFKDGKILEGVKVYVAGKSIMQQIKEDDEYSTVLVKNGKWDGKMVI